MPHPKLRAPTPARRRELSVADHVEGVLAGDRVILGRTITLIESNLPTHEQKAQQVLLGLLPHSGRGHRIGITGVPGAGKSTFIEALGQQLTGSGHRVAVLAIDPSSRLSGGSILGDKTRMNELSMDPNAFIRPSPSCCTLGGVARKTRETMLVCEAAGFDVVLVETVGVGQSETVVDDMVDCFLVLMIAGAGDELQGIKRGLLELTDLMAINKADGDNTIRAERARRDYATALHFMRPKLRGWTAPVLTCSALRRTGLDTIWDQVLEHRKLLQSSGELKARRQTQLGRWMWSMVEERLISAFKQHPGVRSQLALLESDVSQGRVTATQAAMQLLEAFGVDPT